MDVIATKNIIKLCEKIGLCFVRVPCKIAVKDEKKRRFLWELMKMI